MKKFSLLVMSVLLAGALTACATQKAATPVAQANPDKEAAERYANPPPSDDPPPTASAPEEKKAAPQEGGQAESPQAGKDFSVGLTLPNPMWVPMPGEAPDGIDFVLVNPPLKAMILFARVPFNYADGDLNEAVVATLGNWAQDEKANNELPASGVKDGLKWATATGTFEAKPGLIVRRCYAVRQLSKDYDATVILMGMWPEALDAQVRPQFESIVDKLQIVPASPPDAAAPAPQP